MLEFSHIIYEVVIWLFLLYSAGVFLIYSWIGIYALGAVIRYKHENTFADYSIIAANPNAPTFSLIAPAYNEALTIVDNVRSLLSLYYHNLEIIIVNDGSKDDSIAKLIEVYELESVAFFIQGQLETQPIKAIYKSKNPAFKKLVVVDKENGGKADALNVGVNISSGDYIVCIDVDCILEQDAILKLAKPFLEQTDKKVIACGGVIRLANNCKVENGKVLDVNIPKTWLGRTQALEYIRAFVLGRMAWSRASGLILISGAFGAFDRKIVLACGGYDANTVGEDMELVVRMRRYMEDRKEAYEVVNIPDPLCWTEVPETKEVLRKQRNRWMRGTIETLWKHRKMMFNPKYGKLGMISLPYWFFFEFLGPLVEFSGYIIFLIFLLLGVINWPFFFILFALVIASGILYSIYAILVDLVSRQVYTKRKDFFTLITTAVLEPFYFHPIVVKAGVKGFVDYFKKSKSWGEMTRQGFNTSVQHLPWRQKVIEIIKSGLKQWGLISLVFIGLFLIGAVAEWSWYHYHFEDFDRNRLALQLSVNNFEFAFRFLLITGVLFLLLNFILEKWTKSVTIVVYTLVGILQYILFLYFSESQNLLGADAFYYSTAELKQILQASGMVSLKNLAFMVILIAGTYLPFWLAAKSKLKSWIPGLVILCIGLGSFFIPEKDLQFHDTANEFEQNAGKSKWAYFFNSGAEDFLNGSMLNEMLAQNDAPYYDPDRLDEAFPFWRKEKTPDFLGPYFNPSESLPNLVLITVEGLGHAYSSPNGYVGNFTPFIDSLARKSLYWENNFSSSGRTFAALPTLTGSLAFGKNGFLETKEITPHFNLFNVLKKNGFETGFYYGGNSTFDNMKAFLEYSNVDHLIDQSAFGPAYRKLPGNNGESWGYEDQAVLEKMLQIPQANGKPYFNMAITLSTHNPFLINDSPHYEQLFEQRIRSGQISESQKKWALENKRQLVSVLNLDEALKTFFKNYKKRPDFGRSIFIVTGDHSMPEITLESKIDRYHVPLIIYSPLLKEPKHFKNVVSHFDLAPSVLAYYRENYNLVTPSSVAWVGRGLDALPNRKTGIPLMQSKTMLADFVYGKNHLSGDQLFTLNPDLTEYATNDAAAKRNTQKYFDEFKRMNQKFYTSKMLMPDSVTVKFFNK
ncbi:sulfatase-like hydrolase/transferase [Chryseobacterium koreense]|uniref:Glycosyl transferase n=1 Tax=Chryseobacterium koreense CCUG 49689 TaxID=1304281 RepID=A0A0J7J2C6_9FLAO|nr:sulfatase-like hydrolase/transferase [Chryseobacterium koreense]KMQ72211.1 glycosyl transferase [Chryseobacterium koreense CCUG 49689]MBB5334626.1 cellulose synthase/poly-beta-1,6-N-acetylglucosamine synthase-like glycosyltransferase/phosphoglycerol transferase MdoB-like AlkP superfamily enzyme [Chryseobacterium koreense]